MGERLRRCSTGPWRGQVYRTEEGSIRCGTVSPRTWVEITVVQRLLGHSTVTTTANYLHVRQERLAQVKSPLQLLDLKHLPSHPQS